VSAGSANFPRAVVDGLAAFNISQQLMSQTLTAGEDRANSGSRACEDGACRGYHTAPNQWCKLL